jgi:hypothetical protein
VAKSPFKVNPGALTLVACAGLAWAVLAVAMAALAPPEYVPRIFQSSHVEHLAAFYVVALVASAALPRLSLLRLAIGIIVFAAILAAIRSFQAAHRLSSEEDLLCDIAGVWAAMAPIVVGRFRSGAGRSTDSALSTKGPW